MLKPPGKVPILRLLVSGFVQVERGDARNPFVRGAAEDEYAKSIGTIEHWSEGVLAQSNAPIRLAGLTLDLSKYAQGLRRAQTK